MDDKDKVFSCFLVIKIKMRLTRYLGWSRL